MHESNPFRNGYDFTILLEVEPGLQSYVYTTKYGSPSLLLKEPEAVLLFNKTLLAYQFRIDFFELPEGYLCPAVPGRLDYLLHVKELLDDKPHIHLLDVGCGASGIYQLLAEKVLGWKSKGSDINPISTKYAQINLHKNGLHSAICVHQQHSENYFSGIIQQQDYFDVTVCNPPFYEQKETSTRLAARKWKQLNIQPESNEQKTSFGGNDHELWVSKGQTEFIQAMIRESVGYKDQVGWFTCLVSKKSMLNEILPVLKKLTIAEYRVQEMEQGRKQSRFIAWRF
jgi:23S rRNA (adenine1618-N6)-methyltransferase